MRTVASPGARWLLAASLAIWTAIALAPPARLEPAPATVVAQDFSAERALAHVEAIAQRPHPVGSADHRRVRDYVRGEFAKLGLATEVETGFAEFARKGYHASGNIENIVARLPGAASTRPAMLVAHYDSVPRGPGAADDGHGVAVLLETLRALKNSPPLFNDVIFLVTDGEELGLLGAVVFMRDHPWRRQPGVVLNFEARGTGGVPAMFETSDDNLWLIRALGQAVPKASASSFAYEVYKRMPNDTDMTIFKAGGLAGLNFAFIGHPEFYHTANDDVAHLDRASLQEQGRYCLMLAREFGDGDLTARPRGDAVYFPVRFLPLIVYPASWAMPEAWALAAILALASIFAWRRRMRGAWISIPLALVAALLILIAGPAPGASYLLAWPLASGILCFTILALAAERLSGLALLVQMVAPAAVLLLVVPLLPQVVVALGWRGAAPMLAAALLLMLACLLPQLVLILRRTPSVQHVAP